MNACLAAFTLVPNLKQAACGRFFQVCVCMVRKVSDSSTRGCRLQDGKSSGGNKTAVVHGPNCAELKEPSPPLWRKEPQEVREIQPDIPGEIQPDSPKAPEEQRTREEGADDAWEIVQAGSSLNDFRGSQLQAAQLQPNERGPARTLREREHTLGVTFLSCYNIIGRSKLLALRNVSTLRPGVSCVQPDEHRDSCPPLRDCFIHPLVEV